MFTSVPEWVSAIDEYDTHHNTDPKPFIWTKSVSDILHKVIRANARCSAKQNGTPHRRAWLGDQHDASMRSRASDPREAVVQAEFGANVEETFDAKEPTTKVFDGRCSDGFFAGVLVLAQQDVDATEVERREFQVHEFVRNHLHAPRIGKQLDSGRGRDSRKGHEDRRAWKENAEAAF